MNSRKLFGTVVCAILVLATSSAIVLGQDDPAAYRLITGDGEDSPPSSSGMAVDQPQDAGCCDGSCCQSCCCPRWTASADFIIFDRIGGTNQTLVQRVPLHDDPFRIPGAEALNSNDFQQGFCGGPRVGLIRHGGCGYDLELSYFQIDGWSSDRSVGPDDPIDWLVMRAPGGFTQTNQPPYLATQAMAWEYATKLYNAEFNVRWNPCCRVTMLAGFRWINLGENLVGALEPPTVRTEAPFWNGTTTNNLYGFQIGADGKLFERGCFSIDGLVKAGIFDDNAEQTTAVSVIFKQVRSASASTNHAAFVGETGLQCKYQVTKHLLLRAGYEVIWLQGVALAPAQVQENYITASPIAVQALGVNCNNGVFYHGATAGFEYSF
ncbi:MAG: BBP7 family outer membrane beta-barrel protein [Thermoguttaceae bacterium]